MGLNAEEKKQLEALTKKSKEPDPSPAAVSFNLDLSDDKAYERAVKLGVIPGDEPEGDGDGDGDGEPEGDDTPRRRGFFGDES